MPTFFYLVSISIPLYPNARSISTQRSAKPLSL